LNDQRLPFAVAHFCNINPGNAVFINAFQRFINGRTTDIEIEGITGSAGKKGDRNRQFTCFSENRIAKFVHRAVAPDNAGQSV
jgi:hypothetical protein